MEAYLRKFNYISDYYNTVYGYYSKHFLNGYPVTYFSIDWDASVVDKTQLKAATYEKFGVGELSGLKFKRILMLPVYAIQQVQPNYSADQRGYTMTDSERTEFAFPSDYGIKPYPWDVIHFSQEFMKTSNTPSKDIDPLFVVMNVNKATHGDKTHHQCPVKVAPFKRTDLLKQVSSTYMFLEFTKKVHRVDTANLLLKLQKKNKIIKNKLDSSYKQSTGFYLQGIENV